MIVTGFSRSSVRHTVTRLCVKYYQIEDSLLSNTFRLEFSFLIMEGFQIFYKKMTYRKLVCGCRRGRGTDRVKKKNLHFQKKYFETKLGTCIYLEILYLKDLLFCSLLLRGLTYAFLCDLNRFE